MNITIIGGSKGTGAQLATVAIDADHDVTVVSRSGTAPAGAGVVAGDASDAGVLREAITGADAVVVTVGGAKGDEHQRAKVTKAVIAAMEDTSVRRLVVQSSLGAGDSGSQMPARRSRRLHSRRPRRRRHDRQGAGRQQLSPDRPRSTGPKSGAEPGHCSHATSAGSLSSRQPRHTACRNRPSRVRPVSDTSPINFGVTHQASD